MNLIKMLYPGVLALALGGCATNGDPRDPLEPFNRSIHTVNEKLDKGVLKPVAQGYVKVVPSVLRGYVRNFFSNVDDVTVMANDLLQLKIRRGSEDLMRVAINSSFGFLGMLDIASEMGLHKHNEDFGQTLGYWGVPNGPYLVLPFFGPSSFRDGSGLVLEMYATDPVGNQDDVAIRNREILLRAVSKRADLLDSLEVVDDAALDLYEFQRDLYLERRRGLIHDGKPPEEE
jgi:phospholipid-binding lipoprotein MlaA